MNWALVILGVVVALYGVLLWMDHRRTAQYFARRGFFRIQTLAAARRVVSLSIVASFVIGGLLLGAGFR